MDQEFLDEGGHLEALPACIAPVAFLWLLRLRRAGTGYRRAIKRASESDQLDDRMLA